MIRAFGLAVFLGALAVPAVAAGQAPAPIDTARAVVVPEGEPVAQGVLEDPEFGVRTGAFGLDRHVEMYQWYREPAGGFRRVWKSAPIDSAGFPAEYRNPPELPLQGERWWTAGARLDGHPVDLSVLKALGQWHEFRPAFDRLPGNMAATFQPEGNGLGSSRNPLDPQVGDLRIRWRELRLPPLAGRVELRDGIWQLSASTAAAALNAKPLPPAVDAELLDDHVLRRLWALGAGLAVLLLAAMLLWRRRSRD